MRKAGASKAKPVTVSLPESLLAEVDRLVEDAPFAGRSGAVQTALVQFVAEHRAAKGGRQHAVIAVCFGKRDERRVAEVKHEFGDIIRSMLHTHIQGEDCVEVFVVEGTAARVATMYSALASLKGIHLVRKALIPGHEGLV
ncbi:MAG TPA: CopG family ribbon-helix-helix protein [Candidatus Thermoplasmatota archaeon]|jgi:CopG family nickel-responsive transcriptional regulator|nr:CopG family ribbon-helix-helix protein [Candidatus Thermoplasmatota archaeon]